MLASTQATMLSGDPSVVSYFDLLAHRGTNLVRAALSAAVADEERILKESAENNPAWRQLSEDLNVRIKGRNLVIGTSSRDSRKAAKKVEYGDTQQAPVALLRRHLSGDAQGRIQRTFSEHMDKVLN